MKIERMWTKAGVDVVENTSWTTREVVLGDARVAALAPEAWSLSAVSVVAKSYFRRPPGSDASETSVRQVIERVVGTIARWAGEDGRFADAKEAAAFRDELAALLLEQRASFNSPVWYNVGIHERPQCAASFINGVEDELRSVLTLTEREGMQHRNGSGSGVNLSPLRARGERIRGGGVASGPVSFMKAQDATAGAIRRGGLRRAAKMVLLDVDHPDVREFIACKLDEERKAWALIDASFSAGFNVAGGAYDSVGYQNSNHSVRVSDAFMRAAIEKSPWTTRRVVDGEPHETFDARKLLEEMAEAAWACGDPGVQFASTIDAWHTCPSSGPIRGSNSCSEYLFLDDSGCILASLNLLAFDDPEQGFDVAGFEHACRLMILAMDVLVDHADYGAPEVAARTRRHRPLGLGFANLGALLMARGLPYDSEEGRALAASIASLMTGAAYRASAELAERMGPFPAFAENRASVLAVLERHRDALLSLERTSAGPLVEAAKASLGAALAGAAVTGVRHAQVTLLAPAGTISFMMDCDTTGVEPDIALVKYKRLFDGSTMKIVNRTVPAALARLGYGEAAVRAIVDHIGEHDTIEGAPGLEARHLPVFDCAFTAAGCSRSIHFMGHLRMMAAVQPFLSGGISKTVNMPADCTPDDVVRVYVEGWRMGLKALAIYRDGSKRSQPVTTAAGVAASSIAAVMRHLTDAERQELWAKGVVRQFAPGEALIERGSPPGGIFVVEGGEVRIEIGNSRAVVGTQGVGAVLGEVSFVLPGTGAAATVVAAEPTQARFLSEPRLRGVLADRPGLTSRLFQSLASVLAERLLRTNGLVAAQDPSLEGNEPAPVVGAAEPELVGRVSRSRSERSSRRPRPGA